MKVLASTLALVFLTSIPAGAHQPRFNAATGRMEELSAVTEGASTVLLQGLGMKLRTHDIRVEWTGQGAKTTWIGEVD